MDRIVVIGGGGHAKVLISVLDKLPYLVLGYTDVENRGVVLGAQYLGDDTALPDLLRVHVRCQAVVGVGKTDVSGRRALLQANIQALGIGFPVIVSPQAVVNKEVEFGPGTVVFDGAVINSGTMTGSGCILNTHSTLEHDCRLGDNVHLAPGTTVSGGVSIGSNCLIGVGTNIIQGVAICADCLIGAGSTVVRDITVPGTYAGYPARRIK